MNYIVLKTGENAIVDADDFPKLSGYKWHRVKILCEGTYYTSYAARKQDGKSVLMHRDILGITDNVKVDHINGNGLDNRRENLRICTHAENMRNRTSRKISKCGFKGVKIVNSSVRPYMAYLRYAGKFVYLGTFGTAEEAAEAYNTGALKFFGEFAKTNEIKKII